MSRLRAATLALVTLLSLTLSGCAFVPLHPNYQGPPERPPELEDYYSYDKNNPYQSVKQEVLKETRRYTHKKIDIQTEFGPISIDYFQRPKKSNSLIFVLPVLGGRNIIADYFAHYYARHGFDTAIVNRSNDFKDPNRFNELEQVFQHNIIRDRIAIDFFEREYGKSEFGTFGISRGAINVAMTAGVDPRLKYNVMAMGGTDLVSLLQKSDQRGVKKFRNKVMEAQGMSKEEFYADLRSRIITDPSNLARYMDARNTLMFLAVFDNAVPFRYGERLRQDIGNPRTVYLTAGHFTSILFTQYAKLLLPQEDICLFPQDYIESEALAFYERSFEGDNLSLKLLPYRILQMPFNLIGGTIANSKFKQPKANAQTWIAATSSGTTYAKANEGALGVRPVTQFGYRRRK